MSRNGLAKPCIDTSGAADRATRSVRDQWAAEHGRMFAEALVTAVDKLDNAEPSSADRRETDRRETR